MGRASLVGVKEAREQSPKKIRERAKVLWLNQEGNGS